jgi:2-phospho-L-lactate/phosphoenolpyruvate guanylyltransferase
MKVVIPIRGFARAKKRLGPLLSDTERSEIMRHMVIDVLSAVSMAEGISGLLVVTNDGQVQQLVRAYGAEVLPEPKIAPDSLGRLIPNEMLNAIIRMAAGTSAERGEDGILILPADVPFVTTNSLESLLARHKNSGVTLVPARTDGGTNALALSPPEVIAPAFGLSSSQRHCELARAQGIEPTLLNVAELALDIDTVDDLREMLASPLRCSTQDYLKESGLETKIGNHSLAVNGRRTG